VWLCGSLPVFLCPAGWGAGHFCPHFPCFSDSDGEKLFFHRCQNTLQTHTHTYGHTVVHTDICALFIYLWIPLGGCWARFSFLGGNISELFRSGLEILFSYSVAHVALEHSPFILLKKIGILSGWVRGNPPPQHQKWTDESSVSCVKDGREGGQKRFSNGNLPSVYRR
jgi:hypothetical protein